MYRKAFTLIEVLISVVIIFIISMALVKISAQNFNILKGLETDKSSYASAVLNSSSDYRSLYDYINIRDIERFDSIVERKNIYIGSFPLVSMEKFQINYSIEKEKIKIDNEVRVYVKIK